MTAKLWAVGLMIFCTIITSSAQILLKKGAERLPELFTNTPLIIGCFLYGIGAIIFIIALRGGDLTVLYPVIATSYVWVALLSDYYLGEEIHWIKWLGILTIIVGISLIGKGSAVNAQVQAQSGSNL